MTERYSPTWFERSTNPDLITRGLMVGAGSPTAPPDYSAPDSAYGNPQSLDPYFTAPAMRPSVLQRMLNLNVIANTPAVPLSPGRLESIGVIFNVYSTAAASAFWGPNGVTVTSGIEIRPGVPGPLFLDNDREMWELQRGIEHIGAMIAAITGQQNMGPYKAPKVVFDLSQIYVASAAALPVTIIAFLPPEMQ